MSVIAPCVTAPDAHAFREQMARIAPFAKRVHVDFSDGLLAPVKLINPIQAYWPHNVLADLHLMIKKPQEHIETVISLKPHLVIIHVEAEGDLLGFMRQLRAVNIKVGVALLPQTNAAMANDLIADADHVLIFSGNLGHFGGTADLTLLKKVGEIRGINANVEIGWDGGVAADNVASLCLAGIEVLNAGGYIQKAPDPKEAYATLVNSMPNELSS